MNIFFFTTTTDASGISHHFSLGLLKEPPLLISTPAFAQSSLHSLLSSGLPSHPWWKPKPLPWSARPAQCASLSFCPPLLLLFPLITVSLPHSPFCWFLNIPGMFLPLRMLFLSHSVQDNSNVICQRFLPLCINNNLPFPYITPSPTSGPLYLSCPILFFSITLNT